MAQVKHFVAKIISEIEDAMMDEDMISAEESNLDILLRYESKWSFENLMKLLEANAANDAEKNEESLRFLIDFLRFRYSMIKDTDGIYNFHQKTAANLACILVAKNLSEVLGSHYYEYLFPHIKVKNFVSTRGDLSAITLPEFFIGEQGLPIETAKCLAQFQENVLAHKPDYPWHVCLPPEAMTKRKNIQISRDDVDVLASHSSEAEKYYKEISFRPPRSREELEVHKQHLAEAMATSDFTPKYTHNNIRNRSRSRSNLLKNGFLERFGVRDLKSMANLLVDVEPSDWNNFCSAIDKNYLDMFILPQKAVKQRQGTKLLRIKTEDSEEDGGYNERIVMILPDKGEIQLRCKENPNDYQNKILVTPEGYTVLQVKREGTISIQLPDVTVLEDDKFQSYLDKQGYEHKSESVLDRAIIYLIGFRYKRKIENEVGYFKDEKKDPAIDKLLEFITNFNYLINQPKEYLVEQNCTSLIPAVKNGRLGCFYRKLISLGPGAKESASYLSDLAFNLSKSDGGDWASVIDSMETFENYMSQIVGSIDKMIKSIKSQEYRQDDERYNRALLFCLVSYYLMVRPKQDDSNKESKMNAAMALRNFLASNWVLKDLKGYLLAIEHPEYEADIRDSKSMFMKWVHVTNGSVLGTIAMQIDELCKPEYFQEQQKQSHGLHPVFRRT